MSDAALIITAINAALVLLAIVALVLIFWRRDRGAERPQGDAAHADQAWVHSRDQLIDEGWFGPTVTDAARNRMGDVALVAHAPVGFDDPGERHADLLKGRHGSVTSAEMLVPVLHALA